MKHFFTGVALSVSIFAGCCHNRPFFGTNPYSSTQAPQYYAQPVQQAPPPVQYVQQPQIQYVQQPQQMCPQVCPQVCPPACPPCY